MRYLSVCSGIEAATVAWHPLGWEPTAFSEIEAFPRAVLQHHYPRVPLHGDFTQLRREPWIVDADLLVGGTPCQAFSVAGLRNSLSDERGNLSLEFIRLADAIDDLRRAAGRPPAWALWENVPGVLSTRDNAFGAFLGGLVGGDDAIEPPHGLGWRSAGVVAGPRRVAAWRVLDAQYFGVAQRRRRIFVLALGGAGAWRCADALLPIIDSLSGHPAPRREAGEGVAGTLTSSLGRQCGNGGPEGARANHLYPVTAHPLTAREAKGPNSDRDSGNLIACDVADTLSVGANQTTGFFGDVVAHTLRAEGFDASEDGTGRGTPLVPVGCFDDPRRFDARGVHRGGEHGELHPPLNQTAGQQVIAFGGQMSSPQVDVGLSQTLQAKNPQAIAFSCKDHGADAGNVGPTLRAMGHGASHANAGGQVAVALSFVERGREGGRNLEYLEEVAYTQQARAGGGATDRFQILAPDMAVRRITPTEAERLQGFPDGYTLVPYRGKPAADGPRYKALGNSMAVPCMRWIGERIAAVEALDDTQTEAAA